MMKPTLSFTSLVACPVSLLGLCLMSLTAVGCKPSPQGESVSVLQYRRALQEKSELEALHTVAQRRIEIAEQQAAKEKAERERVERGRSLWKNSSAFLIVVAGLMLFFGAAAGSRARKEAQSQNPHHEPA